MSFPTLRKGFYVTDKDLSMDDGVTESTGSSVSANTPSEKQGRQQKQNLGTGLHRDKIAPTEEQGRVFDQLPVLYVEL